MKWSEGWRAWIGMRGNRAGGGPRPRTRRIGFEPLEIRTLLSAGGILATEVSLEPLGEPSGAAEELISDEYKLTSPVFQVEVCGIIQMEKAWAQLDDLLARGKSIDDLDDFEPVLMPGMLVDLVNDYGADVVLNSLGHDLLTELSGKKIDLKGIFGDVDPNGGQAFSAPFYIDLEDPNITFPGHRVFQGEQAKVVGKIRSVLAYGRSIDELDDFEPVSMPDWWLQSLVNAYGAETVLESLGDDVLRELFGDAAASQLVDPNSEFASPGFFQGEQGKVEDQIYRMFAYGKNIDDFDDFEPVSMPEWWLDRLVSARGAGAVSDKLGHDVLRELFGDVVDSYFVERKSEEISSAFPDIDEDTTFTSPGFRVFQGEQAKVEEQIHDILVNGKSIDDVDDFEPVPMPDWWLDSLVNAYGADTLLESLGYDVLRELFGDAVDSYFLDPNSGPVFSAPSDIEDTEITFPGFDVFQGEQGVVAQQIYTLLAYDKSIDDLDDFEPVPMPDWWLDSLVNAHGASTLLDTLGYDVLKELFGDAADSYFVDPNSKITPMMPMMVQSTDLIDMDGFRSSYPGIDGSGYAVVVIDTRFDLGHPAFGGTDYAKMHDAHGIESRPTTDLLVATMESGDVRAKFYYDPADYYDPIASELRYESLGFELTMGLSLFGPDMKDTDTVTPPSLLDWYGDPDWVEI